MNNFKIRQNYVIFQKLGEDSLGVNERAAELIDQKAHSHYLLTSVYPYLSNNQEIWSRIKILLEGIKRSNITSLYSPDKIIKDHNNIFLVYKHKQTKNMEQILNDSAKNNVLLNFDLALSIVLSIADLVDTGASIVVSGKKSFHGMLTPDNIFIDNDGKIFLKNYGIHQYLKSDEIYSEMTKKYGTWLTPEFLRKERIVSQSDIYHLGYLIYRILTGKYFSLNQGEELNQKLSNLSFECQLPSNDKELINKIIVFFKKTLNPNPEQRFSNIKEFKDFISSNFYIEELSSVTFNLAYFMNSIYKDTEEQEEELLKKELQYQVPKEEEKTFLEQKKVDDHLVEDILSGLEEESSKAKKPLFIGLFAIAVLIILGILIIPNITGNKKELEAQNAYIKKLEDEKTAAQNRLRNAQKQSLQTEEEKTKNKEEKDKLLKTIKVKENLLAEAKKRDDLREKTRKDQEKTKNLQDQYDGFVNSAKTKIAANKFEGAIEDIEAAKALEKVKNDEQLANLEKELNTQKVTFDKEVTEKKILDDKKKKEDDERNRVVKTGEKIDQKYATSKPLKLSGKAIAFTNDIKRKYRGKTFSIVVNLLIDENGRVKKVKFISSAKVPFDIQMHITPILNDWKFKPAEKNGVKVKVDHQVTINKTF